MTQKKNLKIITDFKSLISSRNEISLSIEALKLYENQIS
jgi:hypothetical protein